MSQPIYIVYGRYSGEGQRGVIRLEDLIGGKQQVRLQEHSIRALRCTIAPTLLGGSFRDFVARLALLYKTHRKHLRNGFHKQAHAVLTFTQPLFSALAFDAFYRYLRPIDSSLLSWSTRTCSIIRF